MITDECQVQVWVGYSSNPCGRPVKRDGKCGLHAAAAERRERNEAHRRQQWQERSAQYEVERQQEARIRELGGRWPITRVELIALLEERDR